MSMSFDLNEEYVNAFARAFVMPRERFEKIVGQCSKDGVCDINKVAERFGVDYANVYIRGKELGFWE